MGFLKLQFFIVVSIIVHELGHYLAAKLLRMKPDEFSIGSGPVLFKFNRIGTEFIFRLIPINGHVHLNIDIENLSLREKLCIAAIAFCGPAINIITGIAMINISPVFCLASVFSGVFNLLPIPGWDGGQIIAGIYSAITHKEQ